MESAKEMFGTMMLSQSKERATIRKISAAGMITSARSSFSLNFSMRSCMDSGASSQYSSFNLPRGSTRLSLSDLASL